MEAKLRPNYISLKFLEKYYKNTWKIYIYTICARLRRKKEYPSSLLSKVGESSSLIILVMDLVKGPM